MAARRRIYRKYLALIVALVATSLVLSGAVSAYFSYIETRDSLVALAGEKAASAAIRIEDFVDDIVRQASWTTLPQIAEGGDPRLLRRNEFWKLGRQVPAITEASYIDAKGCVQVVWSRLAIERTGDCLEDLSRDPRFVTARGGEVYFGPVYFRKGTEPYMTIAMRAGRGKNPGVTAVEVNLKFILDVVQRIRIGKTGIAYVLDRNGILVAHPDISLVLQKTDFSALPQVKTALQSARSAPGAAQIEAVAETRNRSGRRVLAAYSRIETLGWYVFVEQPVAEAFKPLYATLARSGAAIIAGLVLSVLAGLVFARRMSDPIRALQNGAVAIGSGHLDARIDVRTGDELQDLAERFNRMAADLKESYAGLERKVAERTAELRQALEQQTATAEILKVISASPTDVQPVFDAIVQSGVRLFGESAVAVVLPDGDQVRAAAIAESDPERAALWRSRFPFPLTRDYMHGASILDCREIDVPDAERHSGEWAVGVRNFLESGYRAITIMPMLRGGHAIGAISVLRLKAGPLTDKHLALLRTFADQAVIAIENVRLFREIQDKSAQLEIANRHKSEFLANMSHELRTPLNAIIGFSEVLAERYFGELNEKQSEYVNDIHASGKHLLSLINDILDLSKIEAGRMELDLAEFDLPAALQNAMTLVKERAQRHGIALSLEVEPSLGALRADERKFKQILLNLLSNAVKFTPEGGKVSVAAKPNGAGVEIAVRDTGVGIAPEDQEAVFEEFKQVGRDYTRKAEGTGLGLALTRRFVELHGGRLSLVSLPGEGSTFTFTLPTHHGE